MTCKMETQDVSLVDVPRKIRCPLTAIVLTYNEAGNIGPCLEDLDWVEDVVVVDSGSDDGTVEVARSARAGVRLFSHPFQDFGDQRNWALDQIDSRHDWVLFLDADERCPQAFRSAVQEVIENPDGMVGYYLCYRNYFLGQWLKRTTFFPSWQLRLLRRGEVRYRKMGHGQQEVAKGPIGYLQEPYDHYGFSKGVSHWIERHNAYSSHEIELVTELLEEPLGISDIFSGDSVKRRRCLKRIAARLPGRPWIAFLYTYLIRLGFLDGRAGLNYCYLKLAHDLNVTVKHDESLYQSKTLHR